MPQDARHLATVAQLIEAWRAHGPGSAFEAFALQQPGVVACETKGPLAAVQFRNEGLMLFDTGDDPAAPTLADSTQPAHADSTAPEPPAGDDGRADRVKALAQRIQDAAHDPGLSPAERMLLVKRLTAEIKTLASTTGSAQPMHQDASPGGTQKTRCCLPDSEEAVLVTSGSEGYLHRIEDRLTASGYRVTHLENATVETYRSLPSCGVLVLDAHSAPASSLRFLTREFAIWTADACSPALEAKYAAELAAGDIIKYFRGHLTDFAHYAITASFVEKHFPRFAPHSFVVLNSCHSGTAPAQAFRDALRAKQADVVASWTWKVPDQLAAGSSYYLFDRLTGANDAVTVDVSGYGGVPFTVPNERDATGYDQRPFDSGRILTDMLGKNLATFHSPDGSYNTRLIFEPGKGRFGVLRPSIADLRVDETTSELTIRGLFGKHTYAGKRSVTVDGADVPWSRWDDEEIVCTLPRSGPGSVGEVLVHVGRRTSNGVPLTQWRGEFELTSTIPGQKKPFARLAGLLTLRGDVHPCRDLPGRRPSRRVMLAQVIEDQDASADFSLQGRYESADATYAWRHSGKVPPQASPDGGLVCWLKAFGEDAVRPELHVVFSGCTNEPGSMVMTLRTGERHELLAHMMSTQLVGRDHDMLAGSATWAPGGTYDVPKQKVEATMQWGVNPPTPFPATLTISELRASHVPTPDTLA